MTAQGVETRSRSQITNLMSETNPPNGKSNSDTKRETVEVYIWKGNQFDSYDTILSYDPDIYEIPVAKLEYGKHWELSESEKVTLAEDIDHHGTYAIDVPNKSRPVTVNIHTNDSYHDPEDWDKPIERGLYYHKKDDAKPFQIEMWGRIMMWVERP